MKTSSEQFRAMQAEFTSKSKAQQQAEVNRYNQEKAEHSIVDTIADTGEAQILANNALVQVVARMGK